MKFIPLTLFIIVFYNGCISTSKLYNQTPSVLDSYNISTINGNYINFNNNNSLWDIISSNQKVQSKKHSLTDSAIVSFTHLSNRIIEAKLHDQSKLIDSILIKGSMKENYFSVKRKFLLIPIPLICYIHKETKLLMGKNHHDSIIIKKGDIQFFWIIRSGGRQPHITNEYVFQKIEY